MSDIEIAEMLEVHRIDEDYECPSGCDVLDDAPTKLTTHEMRIAHQAEVIDRVIEQVRADAKREALSSFAIELGERNKLARTVPVMHPYQRGRADSYESAQLLAERWAGKQ